MAVSGNITFISEDPGSLQENQFILADGNPINIKQ
ncbi:MAG: hypothetical protein ACI9Y7_001177 [Dokdonia sp.]|jgi:hypothetical protein